MFSPLGTLPKQGFRLFRKTGRWAFWQRVRISKSSRRNRKGISFVSTWISLVLFTVFLISSVNGSITQAKSACLGSIRVVFSKHMCPRGLRACLLSLSLTHISKNTGPTLQKPECVGEATKDALTWKPVAPFLPEEFFYVDHFLNSLLN